MYKKKVLYKLFDYLYNKNYYKYKKCEREKNAKEFMEKDVEKNLKKIVESLNSAKRTPDINYVNGIHIVNAGNLIFECFC